MQKKVVGPNWYFFEAQRTVQQKERWECVMNLVVFRISKFKNGGIVESKGSIPYSSRTPRQFAKKEDEQK